MLFREKLEVIPWSDFFAQTNLSEEERARLSKLTVAGLTTAFVLRLNPAEASAIAEKISGAFQPVIDLVQGVAYPVYFLLLTGGFLVIMTGNKSKGLHIIKWATLGFLGLQFVPVLAQIVVEVAKAMKT
jgi:hypothetical protein